MQRKKLPRKTILAVAFLLIFLSFFLVLIHICYSRTQAKIDNTGQFIVGEENKIRYAIESRIVTAKALEMYVISQKGKIADFKKTASFLYEDDPALRSIQLAPDGVVTKEYIYPQEDQDFSPHDLFAGSEKKASEKSRDLDQIMLSGPKELKQGGKGIMIKDPIFLENEKGQEEFWGFSIVVFNVPEVFNIAQLNLLTNESYYYRLWKQMPDSEEIQVIVENTDRKLNHALRKDISISDDVWYLDVMPQDGWVPSGLFGVLALVFFTILLLAMAALSSHLKVREVVYYDDLLNIGNGNYLSAVYKKLSSGPMKNIYLVVFDIDKFKEFNYIYGEEGGDRLLKYIVQVFQEEVPKVSLFRYYSDHFITLQECESQKECEDTIERLLERFAQDIEKGRIQSFDISAGVRKIEKGETLQRVISDALIARGAVKGNYIRHYTFYNDDVRLRRISYMEMESNFAKALREKEFCVYYQPKFDVCSHKIVGAEALTRWVREDGVISPGVFIPCFEESRQIVLLDEYVLREVCRQMKEMELDGIQIKPVSVNLSRVHLRHPDILSKISGVIKETGIDPANLSFEITESALLEESIPMKSILKDLHELGCKVEMDDYGIGASSPDALLSNDFDILKLDKSFVDRIGDEKTEDLIRSTTCMAVKWGMKVLAEGVEEKYQAEKLLELGCTYGQGYYYAKPVSEKEYRELLKSQQEKSASVS